MGARADKFAIRERTSGGRRRLQLACVARLACLAALATPVCVACKTGPDLSADYAQTAVENYDLAVGEFQDRDWDEAIQYADFVRIRFPFSRYAVEAELLIARAEFEQANYATAQDAFKQFSKLHPTHKHVRNGWTAFMAAASAFMNAPQGFFLLPPDRMRDQSPLRDAIEDLDAYFDHYTGTVTEKYAVKLRDEVRRRLLEHELYVADYYLDKDKPEAAIGRLEAAHEMYPGIGLDAEVLFLLGITYLRMDEVELARSTFAELQAQHPKHHHGKQARVYLAYIAKRYGPADPSRKRPDRSPPKPKSPPLPKNPKAPGNPGNAPAVAPDVAPPPSKPPPRRAPPPPTSPPPEGAPPEGAPPEGTPPEGTPPEGAPPEGAPPEGAPPEGTSTPPPEGGKPKPP